MTIDVFRTMRTCGCCRLFVCLFFLSFFRFTETSHISKPPRSLRLGNRSIFILDPRLVRISSFWEGSRFLLIQARIRHSALFCRCDFAFVIIAFIAIWACTSQIRRGHWIGYNFSAPEKGFVFSVHVKLNVRKYNGISWWCGKTYRNKDLIPLLPSPSPFNLFLCFLSNFRAITRLETLATQANFRSEMGYTEMGSKFEFNLTGHP